MGTSSGPRRDRGVHTHPRSGDTVPGEVRGVPDEAPFKETRRGPAGGGKKGPRRGRQGQREGGTRRGPPEGQCQEEWPGLPRGPGAAVSHPELQWGDEATRGGAGGSVALPPRGPSAGHLPRRPSAQLVTRPPSLRLRSDESPPHPGCPASSQGPLPPAATAAPKTHGGPTRNPSRASAGAGAESQDTGCTPCPSRLGPPGPRSPSCPRHCPPARPGAFAPAAPSAPGVMTAKPGTTTHPRA